MAHLMYVKPEGYFPPIDPDMVNLQTIPRYIKELEADVEEIDEEVLHRNIRHDLLAKKLKNIRINILTLRISLQNMYFEKKIDIQQKTLFELKLKNLEDTIHIIDRLQDKVILDNQGHALDNLTFITFLFLPLTLITGYFGMNFGDMGSPTKTAGIFAERDQRFVFFLFFISILLAILYVRFIYTRLDLGDSNSTDDTKESYSSFIPYLLINRAHLKEEENNYV